MMFKSTTLQGRLNRPLIHSPYPPHTNKHLVIHQTTDHRQVCLSASPLVTRGGRKSTFEEGDTIYLGERFTQQHIQNWQTDHST